MAWQPINTLPLDTWVEVVFENGYIRVVIKRSSDGIFYQIGTGEENSYCHDSMYSTPWGWRASNDIYADAFKKVHYLLERIDALKDDNRELRKKNKALRQKIQELRK